MLMRCQSDDNKLNRFVSVFTQCVHALVDAHEKRLISVRASVELKRYEEPTLRDFLTRKYWINLSENACGSCLDIYLSGAKRIYYRIYYLWIYLCLKIGFIAVDLTELSYFKNR